MTTTTETPATTANERLLRDLYAGTAPRDCAFTSVPELLSVWGHTHGDYSVSNAPVREWVPWAVENYRRRVQLADIMGDDTVPVARLNTGTQIYAAAFGCQVHCFEDSNPCALPLVSTPEEADGLDIPDIWNAPPLYRVFELAEAVRRELGPDAWLAPCDMQTGFDTACLVWDKSTLLCAMADPEQKHAVKRLAAKCAALLKHFLLELHREFPRMSLCGCPTVWAPPDLGPWPSNDECGAVSTPMFTEYMLPELVDLSETFGSVGMHCCAAADHQMRSFRRIPNFYAFNRVPPPGSGITGFDAAVRELGGPDGPVFVLAWITVATVEHLLRTAPPGTRFILQQTVGNTDDAQRNLEAMRRLADARQR